MKLSIETWLESQELDQEADSCFSESFICWVEVQDGYYRYLAVDDIGGLVIRIVVAEYLACEAAWRIK